jgi:chromosome segregation protein
MKIKKLELIGFKSFVDRTVLRFDHDVLGIVGPNGCGKSNIVDAIRWCMGEQSARHLRGRSMDDVIFSGSESRASNDFAEVTLTFDNDAPEELPLEYKEYAEIAVTRRLHRNGESDYLINKTSVRLRDVTDMFLGTGAGTKAYSIVEQGKVGLIVSAKAEDRRLLIEEAAGITKFKSRKKQAEKKMEMTQQNLLRVGDIVAEIDRSLTSLKRQAAKAERYVAYRNELEDLQLYGASHRYLELVGWMKLEAREVERISGESERARGELATREAELEASRVEVNGAEATLDAAQNASFAAENAVRAEEASIARANDRIAALTQREQQAEGERHEMRAHATRLAAERELATREIAGLAERERTEGTAVLAEEQALAAFVDTHAAADAEASEHRQTIATARAEIASAEAKLTGFERRRNEMEIRRDKLRGERESLESNRGDLAVRAAGLASSIADLTAGCVATAAEKTRLELLLNELKDRIRVEDKTLDDRKGELSRKRSRHGALEEMRTRLEGVGAGTKALIGTRDTAIAGLVADRIEAPAELTQALGGLLGARLQNVVVRDFERSLQLLEDLGQKRKGRATIVPLRCAFVAGSADSRADGEESGVRVAEALRFLPEDEALVRSLVGDAIAVKDLAEARRLRAGGARAVLVTLDGTVLHSDGRVEGGQGDELASGMLDHKREARELATAIERLDAEVASCLNAMALSRAELNQTGGSLDRARHDAHAREIALVTAEKDLQKADGQLEGVARRLVALVAEEAELTRGLDEAGVERDEVKRTLDEGGARLDTAEEELREAGMTLAHARERLDGQRQAVTAAKVAIAATREKLSAARGTESRLSRSARELEERAARVDAELVANSHAWGETAALLALHRERMQAATDHARVAVQELSRARALFEELRGAMLDGEAALKQIRAHGEGIRQELQTHEMGLRERELAMGHLLSGIREKFRGLDLLRVVGDYHMRQPPDEGVHARIEELARLIERMGSVNLDAVREHAEAEERFSFYTAQKADLEKAISDLTRAIQMMNRESRRLFDETFEAVNERFKEIFPRMFRGGRAELRMTNPEDLLETGIDIVAQPPGKKLSSIELMSGGEKALTAVSLIFAIFQIKPSPFCILDEVDAPLDEANVARYNELVRSMTDRSQFILITHIKRTMQMVDVLYGVTMPEAGVSKIVSVKINDTQVLANTQPAAEAQAAVA